MEDQRNTQEYQKRKEKEDELFLEQKIIERDHLQYERDRMQQINQKMMKKQLFVESNDHLAIIKKQNDQEEVGESNLET